MKIRREINMVTTNLTSTIEKLQVEIIQTLCCHGLCPACRRFEYIEKEEEIFHEDDYV